MDDVHASESSESSGDEAGGAGCLARTTRWWPQGRREHLAQPQRHRGSRGLLGEARITDRGEVHGIRKKEYRLRNWANKTKPAQATATAKSAAAAVCYLIGCCHCCLHFPISCLCFLLAVDRSHRYRRKRTLMIFFLVELYSRSTASYPSLPYIISSCCIFSDSSPPFLFSLFFCFSVFPAVVRTYVRTYSARST